MKVSGHRKQILFFLITIILPSLVLVIFTLRMLRQEKELAQKRDLEERRRIARGIGRNMLLRLEEIKLHAMGREPCRADTKNICPEIVLIGVVDEDRLLLPWEICTDRGLPQKLLNESRFREKIAQAERAEFSGNNPAKAARLYARAAQDTAEPVQNEFARLLRARALARAGMKEEARALFSEILSLSSDLRDEFGIPLSYYAGGGLIECGRHHAQVIERVMQDLLSRDWFSPEEAYKLKDLIAKMDRAPDSADRSEVSRCRSGIQKHLKKIEQALALQRDFRGVQILFPGNPSRSIEAETGPFWVAFGENPWLLALLPASAHRPQLLLVVDPSRLTTSLRLEESDQGYAARDFRLLTDAGTDGESPGDSFRGLKISLAETVRKPASRIRSSQPLFYGLVLFVVLGLTLFGAYLLWKDIRRELSLAEMQSHFVSSVSHELKTPLTAIRMFAETLRLGRFKDPRTESEYLDTIINESERLTRLLNNVLDLSKIEKGRKIYRPEPADLAAIIGTVVRAMNYPLSQKGFNLHVDIEQDMPSARVDRDAIEQAILNLLQNAMEYSGDSREIELRLKTAGQYALIQVADRGIGIEPGEQKRIFERFYRIQSPEHARIPGTGLGLAIVDHIARAHGGRVEVTSTLGQGSTFSIFLPLEKRS